MNAVLIPSIRVLSSEAPAAISARIKEVLATTAPAVFRGASVTNTTIAPASDRQVWDLPRSTVDVQLVVEDGRLDTMLRCAQATFDAGAALDITCDVNVIPRFPLQYGSGGDGEDGDVPMSNKVLLKEGASQRGFTSLFGYVAVGGTFDHLHAGHKLLLLTSMAHTTRKLRIGVTSITLLGKKKHAAVLQPFEVRRDAVLRYVSSVRGDVEFEVEEISDMPGGTDRLPDVEALVVSPETDAAVGMINAIRAEKEGFPPMGKIAIKYVGGDSDAERVSSTKLRALLSSTSTTTAQYRKGVAWPLACARPQLTHITASRVYKVSGDHCNTLDTRKVSLTQTETN